jgi:hypothetical protein
MSARAVLIGLAAALQDVREERGSLELPLFATNREASHEKWDVT